MDLGERGGGIQREGGLGDGSVLFFLLSPDVKDMFSDAGEGAEVSFMGYALLFFPGWIRWVSYFFSCLLVLFLQIVDIVRLCCIPLLVAIVCFAAVPAVRLFDSGVFRPGELAYHIPGFGTSENGRV